MKKATNTTHNTQTFLHYPKKICFLLLMVDILLPLSAQAVITYDRKTGAIYDSDPYGPAAMYNQVEAFIAECIKADIESTLQLREKDKKMLKEQLLMEKQA